MEPHIIGPSEAGSTSVGGVAEVSGLRDEDTWLLRQNLEDPPNGLAQWLVGLGFFTCPSFIGDDNYY